jgi:hypothetical protein
MSRDGEPDFTYHVFDLLGRQYSPFSSRLEGLTTRVHPRVVHVPKSRSTTLQDCTTQKRVGSVKATKA